MESMDCPELALKLSDNFYATNKYNPANEGLDAYLDHNGILLSMCLGLSIVPGIFGGPCTFGFFTKHISASWIRDHDTGFRIFGPPPPEQLPMGLILDPRATEIKCLYPVDGVTDTRLNNGCGFQPDAPEASNNIYRMLERWEIIKYKNEAFGKDVKWSEIDCKDFLQFSYGMIAVNNSDCSFATDNDTPSLLLESGAKNVYDTWSNLLGHPVCKVTTSWEEPSYNMTDTILYTGSCVWKPINWLNMIATMIKVILDYPHVHIWNEIIIAKPRAINDIVQAVFLMDGSYGQTVYDAAKMEAHRLGKPLLILHPPTTHSNLTFTCEKLIATKFQVSEE